MKLLHLAGQGGVDPAQVLTDDSGIARTQVQGTTAGKVTILAQAGRITRRTTVEFTRKCNQVSFAAAALVAHPSQGRPGISVGDMDGDGDPDIVLEANPNEVVTMINDGAAKFAKGQSIVAPGFSDNPEPKLVDINADELMDMVLGYYETPSAPLAAMVARPHGVARARAGEEIEKVWGW